jgi:hypothetical protein
MSGDARNTSKTGRWRSLLRAGAVAAALAVVAGVPLAAQAHDGHRGDYRGDWGRHHGHWNGHHRGYAWGHRPYYAPPRYYAPAYGYYAPGYYAPAPGVGLNFTIR